MADMLANLNCDSAVLSGDNLSTHLQFITQALRDRTRIIGALSYGIVDTEDPKYQIASETKPLWVQFTAASYTQVIVSAGKAITPNGDLVELTEASVVTLASLTNNVESLIVLKYSEEDSSTYGRTSDGIAVPVGQVATSTLVSMTKLQWLDPAQTTNEDISNSVVLGVVIWSDTDTPVLITDGSNNYDWNRPWYSPADVMHRSYIGSGVVSETNPHGTGLSDLTAGARSLYDQLTSSGLVLSKDAGIPGVPGYVCYDTFSASDILVDATGSATAGSWFSVSGVWYADLSAYPNTIITAVDGAGNEIPVDLIKHTKRVLLIVSSLPETITIYYTKTKTLSIATASSTAITLNGIDTDDMVVTGGEAITSALTTTVPLRRFGAIPREIVLKINTSGQVFMDPAVLLAAQKMVSVAGQAIQMNTTLAAPGNIGIGVTGMAATAAAFAAVTVTGTDTSGASISETLTFDSSSWSDTAVPAQHEISNQVHYTNSVFATLTSVLVHNDSTYVLTGAGSASFVVIAKQATTESKLARLVTCFWNGQDVVNTEDARRILTTVTDGYYGYTSIHQAAEIMPGIEDILGTGSRSSLIVAEDFQQPVYLNSTNVEWDGTGELNVPVITEGTVRSTYISRCYRSRTIPLTTNPNTPLRVYVRLFGAETSKVSRGSVRIIVTDISGTTYEGILFQADGDGGDFVGYTTQSWKSIAFVISGKCRGFAAYAILPKNVSSYLLTLVA